MSRNRSSPLTLRVEVEKWPLKAPFHITGHTFLNLDIVVVTLERGTHVARGEAAGVYYRKENVSSMVEQIEAVRASIEAGIDRQSLRNLLPAGGARNAVDCALWELEAKRAGRAAWQLAGLKAPKPLLTTYTLGANEPHEMAAGAIAFADARAIKLKLTGAPLDAERVRRVRAARPDVWLAVDANQGFTRPLLEQMIPVFQENRVALIEQPLPVGREAELEGLRSPIPIAADESVQDLKDIEPLIGLFNVVNIKLDKCGGLTEGLEMAWEARRLGFDIMVGNMVGTALAMAPAFLIGQLCNVVDLDGPLFLREDRSPGVVYEGGAVWCPEAVWGGSAAE